MSYPFTSQPTLCGDFFKGLFCLIDAKLKNIEKQFTKLKKKYAKNGKYELKYVGANEFQFKAIESDEEQQAESPTKKTKKAKKNKKKDK